MSQLKTNSIVDASGGNTATINGVAPNVSNIRGKNKIINGAMQVDQRNSGAAETASGVNSIDRYYQINNVTSCNFSVQQVSEAPAGFDKSLKLTITAAGTPSGTEQVSIRQYIEGYNTADLNWGTSDAKTVTLSFWVRSSLTGTFGGAVSNNAFDRTYAYEYTIDSANTWEYKTVTIAGDTTGTWTTDNTSGLRVYFGLGASTYAITANTWSGTFGVQSSSSTNLCATNGATWQITGVQLEAGDTASGFETLSYGETLAMCQRYYYSVFKGSGASIMYGGQTGSVGFFVFRFPQELRGTPTLANDATGFGSGATQINTYNQTLDTGSTASSLSVTILQSDAQHGRINVNNLTNGSSGDNLLLNVGASVNLAFDAEL